MDSLGMRFAPLVQRIREQGILPTHAEFERARDGQGIFGLGIRSLYDAPAPVPPAEENRAVRSSRLALRAEEHAGVPAAHPPGMH
jgi:hypothetical protein